MRRYISECFILKFTISPYSFNLLIIANKPTLSMSLSIHVVPFINNILGFRIISSKTIHYVIFEVPLIMVSIRPFHDSLPANHSSFKLSIIIYTIFEFVLSLPMLHSSNKLSFINFSIFIVLYSIAMRYSLTHLTFIL